MLDHAELCPTCFRTLELDQDFPDLVVWRCDDCHKHYSPTDLNRLVQRRKEELRPDPSRWGRRLALSTFFIILLLAFLFWIG